MTLLIGGAVVLVAGAVVALLFGWGQGDDGILFLSIAASAVAGVLLAIAYVLTRREAKRTPSESSAAGAEGEGEDASADAGEGSDEAAAETSPEAETGVDTAGDGAGPDDAEVVAYPARKRFHKPDCRYADRPGGRTMTRSEATEEGFTACGVCKP